ncbi:MAG: dephospho-CoA kinase [Clostridiales bacterium]|nr:dephospho-CoA kinase [Clostridiales bacterium]
MRIGLTGSIAAGKSTVSRRLSDLGAHILDADRIAREVVEPGTEGLSCIVSAFGKNMLLPDGSLNRKALANRVFVDEEALKVLNSITHPLVIETMRNRSDALEKADKNAPVIWDMPLLIECGAYREMDAVWLVAAERETRIARVMARDNCTREHALLRMAAQMPQEEKLCYANTVFYNDGSLDALHISVDNAFQQLFKEKVSL